jgi:hypothetical protein
VVDGLLEHSRRIFGVILSVALVGICQCVGGVIGLLQLVGFDRGRPFERLPGFSAGFLKAEGVCGVLVELCRFFVFLRLAAEEGEAGAGGRVCSFGLELVSKVECANERWLIDTCCNRARGSWAMSARGCGARAGNGDAKD